MDLFTKDNNKVRNFWVENYSDEDKTFLSSIGFQEKKYCIGYNKHKTCLEFAGKLFFGFWSNDEADKIEKAIKEYLGFEKLNIQQWVIY